MNTYPHNSVALVGTVDPIVSADANADLTDAIDMSLYEFVMFIFLLGDMPSETVDCSVVCDTDSGGSYATTVKAATQLAAHATNNDNDQVRITVKAEDVQEALDGGRYIKGRIIGSATGNKPWSVVALGFAPKTAPVSNLASVQQDITP